MRSRHTGLYASVVGSPGVGGHLHNVPATSLGWSTGRPRRCHHLQRSITARPASLHQKEYERRRDVWTSSSRNKLGTGRRPIREVHVRRAAVNRGMAQGRRGRATTRHPSQPRVSAIMESCLHDRNPPEYQGQHRPLVIAPSGVWIVDAKHYAGKGRATGQGAAGSSSMHRLYVGGRDARSSRRFDMAGRSRAGGARASRDSRTVPVHPVLCFIDARLVLVRQAVRTRKASLSSGPRRSSRGSFSRVILSPA